MPNTVRDISEVFTDSENQLIFEKNISVPLRNSVLPIRANIYRPIDNSRKYPVLITYGPVRAPMSEVLSFLPHSF